MNRASPGLPAILSHPMGEGRSAQFLPRGRSVSTHVGGYGSWSRHACLLGLLGLLAPLLSAVPPTLQQIHPFGAVPGGTTCVVLSGDNLDGALDLWTSFPAAVSAKTNGQPLAFVLELSPDLPVGLGAIRTVGTNGVSNPQLLLLDPLPATAATGTNRTPFTAQTLLVPGAVDGRCEEVRSDYYRFAGRRGQRLTVEVVARRLGSLCDPVLRILDADHRELAAVDDTPGLQGDARLDFRCPKTGDYLLEVRDIQYGGGPRHRYRVRAGIALPTPLAFPLSDRLSTRQPAPLPRTREREPNDGPARVQQVSWPVELEGAFDKRGDRDVFEFAVEKGDRLWIRGQTRSLASPCDLFLRLQTTNGTRIAEANPGSPDEGVITNRFAEAGTYRLLVEELNEQGGPGFRYRLALEPLRPGFALSVETERVSVPAGESFELKVLAQRRDYDGPIRLSLGGLGPGFSVTNAVLAAGTNAANLWVTVPADLALGEFLDFHILGQATVEGQEVMARASTLPALRAVLPEVGYPPPELDGLITLSIATGKSATPTPAPRKKRGP